MNALPAPSPLREIEHAERGMLRALDAWLDTPMGSSESRVKHEAYMDAIRAHEEAVRRAFVTETR